MSQNTAKTTMMYYAIQNEDETADAASGAYKRGS